MADNEIKLNLNAEEFGKKVNEIKKSTKSLEDSLKSVGVQAGVAFAGFTGLIYKSIQAYGEQEKSVNTLNQALKTQGIFSEQLSKQYQEQAAKLQDLSTFGDDAIISAQAQLQVFLKNKTVTKELTQATLDFATAQKIDLESAAQLVGKAIGTSTNALTRYGINVNTSATSSEKLSQVINGLNRQFQGQAQAATLGLGSLTQLKNSFGDIFKEVGRNLAPTIANLAKLLTGFLDRVKNDKGLVELITNVIKVGVALTGTVVAIAGVALAFLKLQQAFQITALALKLLGGAAAQAVLATGIGILLIFIADLALNWELRFKQMKAVFAAFAVTIAELGKGLTTILNGIFTLDTSKITAGLVALKDAFVSGVDEYNGVIAEQNNKEIEAEKAKQQAILEEQRNARQVQVDEYTQFLDDFVAKDEEYAALNAERQQEFNTAALETLRTQLQNENAARNIVLQDRLKKAIDANNKEAQDRVKFGVTYAALNKVINSEEIQGKKQTIDSLAQLAQSGNATLKSIGKAASLVQIGIKTAEGAISAYASLAGIPFVGIGLGIAAAAAITAFGAEQAAKVTAAASGGVVPGVNPVGRGFTDTQPALLTPGELVVPRKSFDEVINAVAASRNNEASLVDTGNGGGGNVAVMIGFDGAEASQVLTARQNEDTALGISRAFA